MAAQQKGLAFPTTDPGQTDLYVELALSATGISAGAIISAYTAFNDPFSEVPKVVGTNAIDDTAGKIGAYGASPTSVGVTLYASAASTSSGFSGAFNVSCTLKGKIA